MAALSKRDHIIDTALKLFYQGGFNATGIEKIITEAGVSKKTLYNHFTSKGELILAVLRKRDETFRNDFVRSIEGFTKEPAEQLLAIYDALNVWFNDKDFCGCMFINASAEFMSSECQNHKMCAEHTRLIVEYIRGIAQRAGASEPDILAKQLMLLVSGATVSAHVCGNKDAAFFAQNMAKVFIDQALA